MGSSRLEVPCSPIPAGPTACRIISLSSSPQEYRQYIPSAVAWPKVHLCSSKIKDAFFTMLLDSVFTKLTTLAERERVFQYIQWNLKYDTNELSQETKQNHGHREQIGVAKGA